MMKLFRKVVEIFCLCPRPYSLQLLIRFTNIIKIYLPHLATRMKYIIKCQLMFKIIPVTKRFVAATKYTEHISISCLIYETNYGKYSKATNKTATVNYLRSKTKGRSTYFCSFPHIYVYSHWRQIVCCLLFVVVKLFVIIKCCVVVRV